MSKTQTPFNFDISRLVGDLKLPVMDVEQIISIQRRNLEAVTAANQVAWEGMQAWSRRQTEIVRETLEEAGTIISELATAGTPEDKIVRQIDRLKQAYEAAVSNARELTELAAKSNGEAVELVSCRICDSLDEIKSVTKKATGRKAA
jgi:phasin family protein